MQRPDIGIVSCQREHTPYQEARPKTLIERVTRILARRGWRVAHFEFRDLVSCPDCSAINDILLLNLAYGFVDRHRRVTWSQPEVAAHLERLGARTIGASSATQEIAQDKLACADLLESHGILSPRRLRLVDPRPDTLIRKPRFGACHRDVTIASRHDVDDGFFADNGFIVQEFVEGPEFTVGVIAKKGLPWALPPLEIRFHEDMGSTALGFGRPNFDHPTDSSDRFGLMALAERIFDILGLSDYARIDFRIRGSTPVVLDVNSLPNLDPDRSFLPIAACQAGWAFEDLIDAIVTSAQYRFADVDR